MSDPKVYGTVQKAQLKQSFYATQPTAFTRFLRTNLIWQAIRFVIFNLRMIRIIRLGHGGQR